MPKDIIKPRLFNVFQKNMKEDASPRTPARILSAANGEYPGSPGTI